MAQTLTATLQTSQGRVVVRLFPDHAPKTVGNFVELAEGSRQWTDPSTGRPTTSKLYDGTIFHRVIPDFMIQGGDPTGTGMGGPGYQFEDEPNGHEVARGVIAMANSGPNTNGSQFFVVTADACAWLDGKHTVFGRVTSGQDVVDRISLAERDSRDRPRTPVVIESVALP